MTGLWDLALTADHNFDLSGHWNYNSLLVYICALAKLIFVNQIKLKWFFFPRNIHHVLFFLSWFWLFLWSPSTSSVILPFYCPSCLSSSSQLDIIWPVNGTLLCLLLSGLYEQMPWAAPTLRPCTRLVACIHHKVVNYIPRTHKHSVLNWV